MDEPGHGFSGVRSDNMKNRINVIHIISFQAMKTKCLDRMVKKQQRRLRRAQKKFLRLKVSRRVVALSCTIWM